MKNTKDEVLTDSSKKYLTMELRSGKLIGNNMVLPEALKKQMIESLEYYKSLFGSDEYARELLELITHANERNIRYDVREKIAESYNNPSMHIYLLTATAGLGKLILGSSNVYKNHSVKPIYGDVIGQKMLEEFDNSVPVIGSVERINDINMDLE